MGHAGYYMAPWQCELVSNESHGCYESMCIHNVGMYIACTVQAHVEGIAFEKNNYDVKLLCVYVP